MSQVLLPGQAGMEQAAATQLALLRVNLAAQLAGPLLASEWERALAEASHEADPYGTHGGEQVVRPKVQAGLVASLSLDVADMILLAAGLVSQAGKSTGAPRE